MYINETCEHYCGDEDCAKCDKYGLLTGGCICAFERFISSIPRPCKSEKCECEPKDNGEEERMSIWAN